MRTARGASYDGDEEPCKPQTDPPVRLWDYGGGLGPTLRFLAARARVEAVSPP
jgi:hypothetical protein